MGKLTTGVLVLIGFLLWAAWGCSEPHQTLVDADKDGIPALGYDISETMGPGEDLDNNGWVSDCNDENASIYEGAPEVCGDGVDQDCVEGDASAVLYYYDADSDGYGTEQETYLICEQQLPLGYVAQGGDCDDNDATVQTGCAPLLEGEAFPH